MTWVSMSFLESLEPLMDLIFKLNLLQKTHKHVTTGKEFTQLYFKAFAKMICNSFIPILVGLAEFASKLKKKFRRIGFRISKCDYGRYHLLGDAAYPLRVWV